MERFLTSSIRRYYEIELPRRQNTLRRWPLLIALHGYEGNKDSMMRLARRIADGTMVVVSLQAPYQLFVRSADDPTSNRPGFGWGTSYKMQESVALHHSNLHALINLAARKYKADRANVFLLGFSQACAFNYRFVFTHPRVVRGVIAVCGGTPGDWSDNRKYHPAMTDVLHIAATEDQWYSREKNLEMQRQLGGRAASLDFRFYDSTHRFPRAAIPHIRRWINKHLQRLS
jgi:predicted esterase